MPPNNFDPAATPIDPAIGDKGCPKCGASMEPIEIGVEGLPLEHLQLCPRCYLVTWSDQSGFHSRQGVPMKAGYRAPSEVTDDDSMRLGGDPEEC